MLLRFFQRYTSARGLILMYHRIAAEGVDPWLLCVTPQHFEEHLQVLQQWASPISLQNLVQEHQSRHVRDRAVAITFDDGYANNLYNAKPILERYQIPATVFVTTGYSNRNREFWWDELDQVLLHPETLPEHLSLTINDQLYQWVLGKASEYRDIDRQRDRTHPAWQAPPGSRLAFYYAVWKQLQPLTDVERLRALDSIIAWANVSPIPRLTHRPMTPAELHGLEQGGLVEVGAHTVSHPLLSKCPIASQRDEIQQSKMNLEAVLQHPVKSFAYPFGVYQSQTVPLVAEAGFTCACTTVEETVWSKSDRYQLPRFEVRNWSGAEFQKRLRRWLHH
jgi:peptidoglycan/xylan/chitin deacetylase (PgdA/CDA1 family)